MMAIGAAALARIHPAKPWNWFALYSLVQVLYAWLGMLRSNVGDHGSIYAAQVLTVLAGMALLIEFAGRGRRAFGRAVRYRQIFYLSVVALGGLARWQFGEVGSGWCLCFASTAASLCAALELGTFAREQTLATSARRIRLIGWLLPLYGFVSTLPRDASLPEWFNFSDGWAHAAAAVIATCLSLAVYEHNAIEQQQRLPANAARAWRRRRYLCATGVWVVVIAGWFVANHRSARQDRVMRQQILSRTQLAAASTDINLVNELEWNDSDLNRRSYAKLKELMMSLRRSNPDLRFALLAGMNAGSSYFLVDSEPPTSDDYSPPGQLYAEADPAYLRGMGQVKQFVLGPVSDRWGTWVIGSVRIGQLSDGRSVNMELDVSASNWEAEVRLARLPVLLITILISVIILGFFQAQERLRETSSLIALAEERSRTLVEGSPDCVQMFDISGRYLAVNGNGLKALGLAQASVIGRYFWEIWPDESQPAIRKAIERTISGEPMSFDAEYVRPDGRRVTWRVATNPVRDAAGRVCNFVGICVDLTDRKHTEEALRAAKDAAEAATLAKSEFLAVMGHELRTPLAGVIGMLDLLRSSPPEHVRREYTAVARDSAETLLRILDDILDMAKIEASRLTLETIPFRPRHEFRHLCEAARLRAETKGLNLQYFIGQGVPEVLLGDPIRLRQILGNLQNNALKFTEHGHVTVRIDSHRIDSTKVQLLIAVQDTGIGISEKNIARLFTKFEQGDLSTTRRYGGTGLGLSIVKAMADAMNGTICVNSRLNEGSTFIFAAPFLVGSTADVPEHLESVPTELPVSPQRLHILCAEDENVNRMVAEALVTRMGHSIEFAHNGKLAIERLRKERYDLVFMDNRMPVMDGFQATRLIRGGTSGVLDREIYICAATANVSDASRLKCLDSGMNDYIGKPIVVSQLAAVFVRAVKHLKARGLSPVRSAEPSVPAQPRGLSEAELLASLDEEHTDAVSVSGGPTFPAQTLDRLRALFWEEAPGRVIGLRDAYEQGDMAKIGDIAHALKSAARYVGAQQLSNLVTELERLAEHGTHDLVRKQLELAEAEFSRLQTPAAEMSSQKTL